MISMYRGERRQYQASQQMSNNNIQYTILGMVCRKERNYDSCMSGTKEEVGLQWMNVSTKCRTWTLETVSINFCEQWLIILTQTAYVLQEIIWTQTMILTAFCGLTIRVSEKTFIYITVICKRLWKE